MTYQYEVALYGKKLTSINEVLRDTKQIEISRFLSTKHYEYRLGNDNISLYWYE
jgi:hypothetical protein